MSLQKVIWSEGLLLTPQHFQQQDRYLQRVASSFHEFSCIYGVGFRDLRFDQALLQQGKIALQYARGIMPDLTPFDMPAAHTLPRPVDAGIETRNSIVYLALPIYQSGSVVGHGGDKQLARMEITGLDIADDYSSASGEQRLDIGNPNFRIVIGHDEYGGFSCLPLARISEVTHERGVQLCEDFIPPCLSVHVAEWLKSLLSELATLFHFQAKSIAARIINGRTAGHQIASDYLALQFFNRYSPLLSHIYQNPVLHPHDLFVSLLQITGEIATFAQQECVPPAFPDYHHLDLRRSFHPLASVLRQYLKGLQETSAISIPLALKSYGIRIAAINDRAMIESAIFILAIKADLAVDQIRSRFPAMAKLAPAEQIRQLVNLQLPGMKLNPLAAPPRQLPSDPDCCYFEVDRGSGLWKSLQGSSGFALHVAEGLPGLSISFWAIRN